MNKQIVKAARAAKREAATRLQHAAQVAEQAQEQADHATLVQEGAQQVFNAICMEHEAAAQSWQTLLMLVSSGVTLEEIEAIPLLDEQGAPIMQDETGQGWRDRKGEPRPMRLPDLVKYRKAKQRINALVAAGVPLIDDDGHMVSSFRAEEIIAAKRKKKPAGDAATGEDADPVTPSTPGVNMLTFTDNVSVVQAAFAKLLVDPGMRKAFRDEIMKTARALANDEATLADTDKPRTLRVSPRRAKLAAAAARVAAKEKAAEQAQEQKPAQVPATAMAQVPATAMAQAPATAMAQALAQALEQKKAA